MQQTQYENNICKYVHRNQVRSVIVSSLHLLIVPSSHHFIILIVHCLVQSQNVALHSCLPHTIHPHNTTINHHRSLHFRCVYHRSQCCCWNTWHRPSFVSALPLKQKFYFCVFCLHQLTTPHLCKRTTDQHRAMFTLTPIQRAKACLLWPSLRGTFTSNQSSWGAPHKC